MTTTEKEIQRLLREHKFKLHRTTKHDVWKNAAGLTFITSATPSDLRAAKNALRDLRRLLGLTPQHVPGTRRPARSSRASQPSSAKLPSTAVKPVRTWRGQLQHIKERLK